MICERRKNDCTLPAGLLCPLFADPRVSLPRGIKNYAYDGTTWEVVEK